MVCPLCVIDGIVIVGFRFLGVPDIITAYLIGIFTLSIGIVTLKYVKKKLFIEHAPKYYILIILFIYSTITLWGMKSIGMW